MYYVYILKNKLSGKPYIGSAKDLKKRFKDHMEGKVFSTKNKKWELFYYEAFKSESLARKREKSLKGHGNSKRQLFSRIGIGNNSTGFVQHYKLPNRSNKNKTIRNSAGFTLIELLIVIAILSIVGALSIPYVQGFQASSDAFTIASSVTKTLRQAQQQAIDGKNAADWGVYFDDNTKTFTLFLGSSYESRDTSYDLYQIYPDGISIATDFSDEIYFTKFSGNPSVTGTITLATPGDTTYVVEINSSGVIEVQ